MMHIQTNQLLKMCSVILYKTLIYKFYHSALLGIRLISVVQTLLKFMGKKVPKSVPQN